MLFSELFKMKSVIKKFIVEKMNEYQLFIINKVSNQSIINSMMNILIMRNNLLLLFYLLDNDYKLSKGNILLMKN